MMFLAFACARKALGIEGIRRASPEQCQDRMGAAHMGAGTDHLDSGPPAMECLQVMVPLNSIAHVVMAGSIVAACLLAHAASAAPAGVATAPTCRELER